ncbi:MAG: pentapeptide repeat-containing protein [Acidimicrobiia bacterium]|nr:pentapeptide repeat-containing protein [Acidimicrobiia bacterium]
MSRRGGTDGTSGAGVHETSRGGALQALEEARSRRPQEGERGPLPRPSSDIDFGSLALIRADLAGLDLSGADLSSCDLSNADMRGTRLVGADLRGATLFGTNLTGAELLGANLDEANLTDAELQSAGFGKASAVDAQFFNVNATSATFTGADLTNADFRAAHLENTRMMEATLRSASFDGAKMSGADLSGSPVDGASFRDTDLTDTRLRSVHGYQTADWIGADLRNVDFTGAWLLRRHALDENYLHEFRNQSDRHEWLYKLWWITSDCGRSLFRWTAWTVVIAMIYAVAYTQVTIDWGDAETSFSPVYYSVVTFTTLGYGDVLPGSVAAQILAVSEVILGYFSLGGMMSILSDKIARRSG